ncbi:hypothetical protein [Salinarimonas chemoclinalis]|uniref:hypothetical protein n=1 Tax=Salinarimonas chemoclinalis TaxID=3241599 RepID=UPI00355898E9
MPCGSPPDRPPRSGTRERLCVRAAGALRGRVRPPGSPEDGHAALVLGALAIGETAIRGMPSGEAVARTARACRALGARVTEGDASWTVAGTGVGGLSEPTMPLVIDDAALAPILGACASHPIDVTIAPRAGSADDPVGAGLREALAAMGARLAVGADGGGLNVRGAREAIPIAREGAAGDAATARAVLVAGLNAPGRTTVVAPAAGLGALPDLMARLGARIHRVPHGAHGRSLALDGQPELVGVPLALPADPACTAALVLAALVVPGSDVVLDGLAPDGPTDAFLAALRTLGADIAEEAGDPAGLRAVRVRAGAPGAGGVLAADAVAALGPTLPALALAAASSAGESRLAGACAPDRPDAPRISALAAGLAAMGIAHRAVGDDLVLSGGARPPAAEDIVVPAAGDPVLAVALAAFGASLPRGLAIAEPGPIDAALPDLERLLRAVGAELEETARWAS